MTNDWRTAEMISESVLERLDDAIEAVMLGHEPLDNDSRCSCGTRNNMDGDVLHLHRMGLMSDAVRKVLEPQHDSTNNLSDDDVFRWAILALQLLGNEGKLRPGDWREYRDSAQKWLELAHYRLGQV
jgi:hypothetical protein